MARMEATAVPTDPAPRHPWVWAVLYFPFGLTIGFPSIALGYLEPRRRVGLRDCGSHRHDFLAPGWKFVLGAAR